MVLIPDVLSDLIAKGEVTERYYNPGDLFREVHIVTTNEDRPPASAVQPMVGNAQLHLHNLPPGPSLFLRSAGWRPFLLRRWARAAVRLAADVQPQLIRCHGAHLNAFAASEIRRASGCPYVVSMHGNPDLDLRRHWRAQEGDWRFRVQLWAAVAMERAALANADCVVCVYRFIEPYARRMGARRVEVIYNVVNGTNIFEKDDYSLTDPPKVIAPGRQFLKKDPRPLVAALADVANVRCTFVGDGAFHESAKDLARQLGVSDRCEFIRAMPNDQLCRGLKGYDALVSINDYGGVSKVEIEAALVGMPIITNTHPLEHEPEVLGQACVAVTGDAASYAEALRRLLADESLRQRLGTAVRRKAREIDPSAMEARYVALYRELVDSAPRERRRRGQSG